MKWSHQRTADARLVLRDRDGGFQSADQRFLLRAFDRDVAVFVCAWKGARREFAVGIFHVEDDDLAQPLRIGDAGKPGDAISAGGREAFRLEMARARAASLSGWAVADAWSSYT